MSIVDAPDHVSPDEEAVARQIADAMTALVRDRYPSGVRPMRRDAHPKHHGLVRAAVDVPADVPADLRHGVFAVARHYDAWIRFSNSDPSVKHDWLPDVHGMAIKLLGVAGPKILDDERDATTQDFLLADFPAFFACDAAEFQGFGAAVAAGKPGGYFFGTPRSKPHIAMMSRVVGSMSRIASPLTRRYWSQTAYRLGPNVVKVSAVPTSHLPWRPAFGVTRDYLRKRMAKQLASHTASFDLCVQFCTDPATMPLDNPTVRWSEERSPFVTVARITIPRQTFDTPDQQTFGEHISFTPWHSLPEHEPLGSINRARRVVYETISRLRHEQNGVRRVEPASLDVPAGGLP